jgi:hypothetical protein
MPRWALLCLLVAFIVPGLFGHDLWPPDAPGFGRMWAMANGTGADWLLPNVAGALATQGGPLPYWFGAVLVRFGGSLVGDTNAAAAANLFWYPLAIISLWHAVYRLARRDEAQPVAGAFGGEASRNDYARLVADISALLMIGTIGMIWRLHQTQANGASIAIVAVAIFATSLAEWRLLPAALLAGLAAGALALTQGPMPAAGLLLGCLVVFWRSTRGTESSLRTVFLALLLLILIALAVAASWPLAAFRLFPSEARVYFDAWTEALPIGWLSSEDVLWSIRTCAWFLWPLWPLAAWAVYAWRSSLFAAHLERPLLLLVGLAAAMLFSAPLDERAVVGLIPPLVVLAAFGATTLRRALDNVIDWFAIAVFSLSLIFFWAYYFAMQIGAPHAMAASIAHLAPGFVAHVHVLSLVLAVTATAAWAHLIAWRVLRRPRVLWRGPLLAGAGVTIVWITANLLFLPAVDYVFSYRTFAIDLAAQLQARGLAQGCVQAHRIPLAERAIIAYYGKVRFDRDGSSETCRLALHRDSRRSALDDDPPPGARGTWELSWEGRRRAHPDERWRIWVRSQ